MSNNEDFSPVETIRKKTGYVKTPDIPKSPTLEIQTTYKGGNRLLAGIVLGVITFWLFAQTLLNVAPDVEKSISIPRDSLNMAISLSSLFSGCFIVAAGGLADKLGRVKLTYVGLILSIIGSACLVLAEDSTLFIAGRVIQGLSAACVMPATIALIKEYYEGKDRQRALSFWSLGSWGAMGINSLAGGAISTYLGWRWIFIISIACALLSMFLIKGTPESKMKENKTKFSFDITGLIFFVVSLITLNLLITKGKAFGWASPITLGLAGIFIVSAIIFFVIESGKKTLAFIDFSLFKDPAYSGATLSNFMLNSVAGTGIVVSRYIQNRGFSSFETGLLSLGYLISVLIMIRVGEKILQKKGAKKPMILGSVTAATGILFMTFTFLPDNAYLISVMLGYIIFGLGMGMYATPSIDTAVTHIPSDKAGIASGIYKMASSLGGAFGIAFSTSIVVIVHETSGGEAAATSAGLAFSIMVCILALLSIIFMIPANTGKEKI